MEIRTAIIDDERPARERLRSLLESETDIRIVAEAGNVAEAVDLIAEHRPALIFLDINMPGGTGFQVLRALPAEIMPCAIFTTAYDSHAVEAFQVRALDYLLKPFTAIRLRESLQRAREHLQRESRAPQGMRDLLSATPARGSLERLLVRTNDRYVVVQALDIDWVEAAANYVVLHTRSGNHVLRRALSSLEEELPAKQFFRVSRSALVNLNQIVEIQFVPPDDHVIVLRAGAKVPLTRGLRELQDRLQFLR